MSRDTIERLIAAYSAGHADPNANLTSQFDALMAVIDATLRNEQRYLCLKSRMSQRQKQLLVDIPSVAWDSVIDEAWLVMEAMDAKLPALHIDLDQEILDIPDFLRRCCVKCDSDKLVRPLGEPGIRVCLSCGNRQL